MSLRVVTWERLEPLLEQLFDPQEPRNNAIQTVIDTSLDTIKSPFVNGPTIEEMVLLPICVRLGVAVRIIEIAEGVTARDSAVDGFGPELELALVSGYLPAETVRNEAVFWDQIIPGYVSAGYNATT